MATTTLSDEVIFLGVLSLIVYSPKTDSQTDWYGHGIILLGSMVHGPNRDDLTRLAHRSGPIIGANKGLRKGKRLACGGVARRPDRSPLALLLAGV